VISPGSEAGAALVEQPKHSTAKARREHGRVRVIA
jgi:hypothetical protein